MTTNIENTATIGIKDKQIVTSANAGELSAEELEKVVAGSGLSNLVQTGQTLAGNIG